MRWLVIAVVAAIYSWGVNASQTEGSEGSAASVASVVLSSEAIVTVTPIPPPASVTEFRSDLPRAKKLKIAKKKSIPKAMLSRTERHQMALLAPKTKISDPSLVDAVNDEDTGSGIEDLDLHRSFSRPKLAEADDQNQQDVDDEELPDTIKLRLFLARMKAVQAHQKKFS